MALRSAIGCGFIGFGPVVALFLVTVARHPLRIILLALSAFFWLVGLLVSSLLWFAVVPLREKLAFGLVFTVIFQEIVRFLFYLLVRKADYGLQLMVLGPENEFEPASDTPATTTNGLTDRNSDAPLVGPKHRFFDANTVSYAAGLGFALMGCVMEYIYLFIEVQGPGTLRYGPNPGLFFILAALDSCFMALLQIAWSVILFRAYRVRSYIEIIAVVVLHIGLSELSLLNENATPMPEIVCGIYAIALVGCFLWAFFSAGGKLKRPAAVASSVNLQTS